ncbi:hypothetical protein CRUP_008620, partial [Coryphaenoides rupestris]
PYTYSCVPGGFVFPQMSADSSWTEPSGSWSKRKRNDVMDQRMKTPLNISGAREGPMTWKWCLPVEPVPTTTCSPPAGGGQVTQRLPGDLISLEYWRRERSSGRSLRAVPFLQDYRAHHWPSAGGAKMSARMGFPAQAFRSVGGPLPRPRHRSDTLGLLRVNEELAALRWLPCALRGRSYALRGRSYTLREFRRSLTTSRGQSLDTLETLLRQRTAILHAPTDRQRPRHLHLAQRRGLEAELERAGRACRDLGRLASLANHMVAQALCSLGQREATSFLKGVVQAELERAGRACRDLGRLASLANHMVAQALCSLGQREATSFLKGVVQEAVQGALLDLSSSILQGRRLRGCCLPLSRSSLEWQLRASDVSEDVGRRCARIIQARCPGRGPAAHAGYAWLADVRSFTDQWGGATASSSSSLEALRGGAVSAYDQLIGDVRRWSDRIRRAPPSFAAAATGRLFLVDASGLLEKLGIHVPPKWQK